MGEKQPCRCQSEEEGGSAAGTVRVKQVVALEAMKTV